MFVFSCTINDTGGVEGMHSSSPMRSPKLQLTAEQPSTGEYWIPPTKDTPHPRQRRSPNKMVGGAKSCLESNPIPARDTWRAQTKPCVNHDPETPETESDLCLSVSCRGTGQQWPAKGAGALAAADLGHLACGMSPLGGGHH